MNNLELIEAYFQNSLTSDEQESFEKRCEQEKSFAEEVAFYIGVRDLLKSELLQTKRLKWEEGAAPVTETAPIQLTRKPGWQRWLKYAVAACVVLAVATYFFERPVSTKQLADDYVAANFSRFSHNMGIGDKMVEAKEAFNNKDYETSITLFNAIISQQPGNADAVKNQGIVYLVMNNYDNALESFQKLSARTDLQVNEGDFLQAVTLMERNKPGDKEEAKILLQQVVQKEEEGSEKAKEWLEKF